MDPEAGPSTPLPKRSMQFVARPDKGKGMAPPTDWKEDWKVTLATNACWEGMVTKVREVVYDEQTRKKTVVLILIDGSKARVLAADVIRKCPKKFATFLLKDVLRLRYGVESESEREDDVDVEGDDAGEGDNAGNEENDVEDGEEGGISEEAAKDW